MHRARQLPLIALAAACSALLLTSCGEKPEPDLGEIGPVGTLTVSVEPKSVKAGARLRAAVVNDTASRFTYGADYALERQGPNGFRAVQLPKRPVVQIAYIAEPGETGPPVRVRVPANAQPGTWRVVIQRDVPLVGDLAGQFRVRNG